jgi:dienelactone hydrolase
MDRSFPKTFVLVPALLLAVLLSPALLCANTGEASAIVDGAAFAANDTLACGAESDADATACLDALKWNCVPFTVRCETAKPDCGDWLVRFPTPFPSGDATNDLVAMEWYVARDESGKPMKAPAMVVVHESGRNMVAGRAIAKGLRGQGIHTFLIHLPGYGERASRFTSDMKNLLPGLRQAVSDVRRARDAVAALPFVNGAEISLQGTSLGGFVVATVAGLDRGYDKSFILLAGGHIAEVLLNGKRDATAMHRRLEKAGVTEQQIRGLTQAIEPMRLAHRVNPATTWVYSGKFDDVVPPACTLAFVKAAKLGMDHHVIMPVGHYSAAVLLPALLPKLGETMRAKSVAPAEHTVPADRAIDRR